MLQTQSVYPSTLELLNHLMQDAYFASFSLVGGTALALQYGHRISVDLDLFSETPFDTNALYQHLFRYGELEVLGVSHDALNVFINQIKVDFIHYPYALIAPVIEKGNIRFLDVRDIAAMKLWAVSNRGSKKDFVDLFVLLDHFSLPELLGFFRQKYPQVQIFHVIRSLCYFEDAETAAEPIMLFDLSWESVKYRFVEAVRQL